MLYPPEPRAAINPALATSLYPLVPDLGHRLGSDHEAQRTEQQGHDNPDGTRKEEPYQGRRTRRCSRGCFKWS